jgi:serine/threonine protein kinase
MTDRDFFERFVYDSEKDILGSGGFGTVYKAYDKFEKKHVAIKISQVKDIFGKFTLLNEVELSRKIDHHTNVARYEFGLRVTQPFLIDYAVMDYYQDGNLEHVLKEKQGKLSDSERYDIIEGILEGLKHLHTEGVIHRDIKLANILMHKTRNEQWRPKIADFGLSRLMDSSDSSVSNSAIGITIAYAAPEQIENYPIKKNVDLWAFGVILYRLMTGKLPFVAANGSDLTSGNLEISRKIVMVDLPSEIDTIPQPYQYMIKRCFVKDTHVRAQIADELLDILKGKIKIDIPVKVEEKIEDVNAIIEPIKESILAENKPKPVENQISDNISKVVEPKTEIKEAPVLSESKPKPDEIQISDNISKVFEPETEIKEVPVLSENKPKPVENQISDNISTVDEPKTEIKEVPVLSESKPKPVENQISDNISTVDEPKTEVKEVPVLSENKPTPVGNQIPDNISTVVEPETEVKTEIKDEPIIKKEAVKEPLDIPTIIETPKPKAKDLPTIVEEKPKITPPINIKPDIKVRKNKEKVVETVKEQIVEKPIVEKDNGKTKKYALRGSALVLLLLLGYCGFNKMNTTPQEQTISVQNQSVVEGVSETIAQNGNVPVTSTATSTKPNATLPVVSMPQNKKGLPTPADVPNNTQQQVVVSSNAVQQSSTNNTPIVNTPVEQVNNNVPEPVKSNPLPSKPTPTIEVTPPPPVVAPPVEKKADRGSAKIILIKGEGDLKRFVLERLGRDCRNLLPATITVHNMKIDKNGNVDDSDFFIIIKGSGEVSGKCKSAIKEIITEYKNFKGSVNSESICETFTFNI